MDLRITFPDKIAPEEKKTNKKTEKRFAICAVGTILPNSFMPKWRNGRRTRLKIWRPRGREGSTPSFGTISNALICFFPLRFLRHV